MAAQSGASATMVSVISPPRSQLPSIGSDSKKPALKKLKTGFKLRQLDPATQFGRTNDDIHSSIEMDPVMKAFVDTPQVQRLRSLKQLGTAEYAYMNANHNRFEHSMGVAHLGEQFCRRLQSRQPQLQISEKDTLCVKLAGLCHDLGHGPFSHVYDDVFPAVLHEHLDANPELKKLYKHVPPKSSDWKHEQASLMMIDSMLEDLGLAIDLNHLDKPLKQIGDGVDAFSIRVYTPQDNDDDEDDDDQKLDMDNILTSRDFVFIKEMITHFPLEGLRRYDQIAPDESGYLGRPARNKEFLYMIIANCFHGLDVDKIDYFARDVRGAYRGSGEIEHRFLDEQFVAWAACTNPEKCPRCQGHEGNEHLMICYPDKMVINAVEFFQTRFRNHTNIYTHKTTQAATYMIADILKLADPYFRISTALDSDFPPTSSATTPELLPISQASRHPIAHLKLRDSVIDQIMHTTDPNLRPARLLIQRLWSRDLYKCVADRTIDLDSEVDKVMWKKSKEEIRNELLQLGGVHSGENGSTIRLVADDIIIEKRSIHNGAKAANPVLRIPFLPKRELRALAKPIDRLPVAKPVQDVKKYDAHFYRKFQELSIRVYCRDSSKADLLKHVFSQWNKTEQDSGFETGLQEITSEAADDNEQMFGMARQLTQEESEYELTPKKALSQQEDIEMAGSGGYALSQESENEGGASPAAKRNIFRN